jgi:O-antigen/teichoic acid export membrane protein
VSRPINGFIRYGAYVCSVGGARVAGILITSVTFPYVVRKLGVEGYGLWSYVLAVCAFLEILANPGLTTYASQQLAAHRESAFQLVPNIISLRFCASFLALIVLMGVVGVEQRHDVRLLFLIYGTGIFLTNLIGTDYLLNALEMFHVSSGLRIAQQLMYAAGIFLLIRGPKDIYWLPVAILFSSFITNIAGWIFLSRRGLRFSLSFRPSQWRGVLVPSVHYGISSMMSTIYHRMGHIIVRWLLGEYALGLYAAAVRLVDFIRNLVGVFLSVVAPRMARATHSDAEFKRWAQAVLVIVVVISAPLAIGLMATSHLIVPWILGVKYSPVISLVRWIAPYIITASAASLLSGTILYAMGRHREYLISTATGAAAGVLLYCILIPALGLTGAALAFVLAELFVATSAYLLLPGQLRGLWRSPIIGVSLGSALIMLPVIRITNNYNFQPWIVISAGALVYIVFCGWFFKKWMISQFRSAA